MSVASPGDGSTSFTTQARNIPEQIPANWTISDLGDKTVRVDINGEADLFFPTRREATVQAAGQLPSGFDPSSLYQARSHPRGLQMAVYGASDALYSSGLDWADVCSNVSPDQVSVYAGSAMGQLDQNGYGGMVGGRYKR